MSRNELKYLITLWLKQGGKFFFLFHQSLSRNALKADKTFINVLFSRPYKQKKKKTPITQRKYKMRTVATKRFGRNSERLGSNPWRRSLVFTRCDRCPHHTSSLRYFFAQRKSFDET